MKRRDFLKNGLTIGVAANALPVMMGGMPVRALGRSPLRNVLESSLGSNNNVLVIIQLQGGNDGLNCLVPFGDPNYAALRPTLGLSSSSLTSPLPDHNTLAFHSGMDGFLQLYSAGKMAILQNVGYSNPSLSHFRGTDIWNTATDSGVYASTGWIGRFLQEQNPNYPPTNIQANSQPLAIQFGSGLSNLFLAKNGGMGIAVSRVPSPGDLRTSTHNYDDIPANPTTQYNELAYVRIIQQETEVYSQSLIQRKVTTNKVTYPTTTLASQLASIAQLIASGFQTKIYLVTQGSYDTHSNELNAQGQLLTDLSAAVLAFQQDIEAFGVADQVAIMTYSEFGRRPKENGSGTDHGTAAPHFIIGTQVKGMVYGNDPKLDTTTLAAGGGNLTFDPQHDFRNVYATVMNEWLLAGGTQNTTDIQSILTSDPNGTYSVNSTWQSLGVFKAAPQQYVGSDPEAMGLMLLQNYPNPASGQTQIQYTLDQPGTVELGIYTTNGVEVMRVVDGRQAAGPHTVSCNVNGLPSGTYIYRLKTISQTVARQMTVEK